MHSGGQKERETKDETICEVVRGVNGQTLLHWVDVHTPDTTNRADCVHTGGIDPMSSHEHKETLSILLTTSLSSHSVSYFGKLCYYHFLDKFEYFR